MSKFSVLTPEATVNYIKNPALRYDTTDWNAQGATLTRVLTRARFGVASLQVVTAGSALREGAFFRVSALTGVSEPITVSAYVRGTGKVRIRLDNNVVGGAEYASQPVELTDSRWQRISMTGFSTGGNDLRLYVETDEGTAQARTFYVDGAQLERKGYPTTYCDGDQPGCRWNGVYHNSASQRDAKTRAGGKWVELATDRENEDLYMTVVGGLGMAPMVNNVQSFALQPGGYFSNRKTNMRVITITFHAKHLIADQFEAVSLQHLHELRQFLIDLVKPDLTGGDEPIWFGYDDGEKPVYFQARYDGGLEGEWDIRNQFFNTFPLRLLAENPAMLEDSQETAALDFQGKSRIQYVAGKVNGQWNNMNYGMNTIIFKIGIGIRGQVYAVGQFTVVNNNAAAIDPLRTANRVAEWDGEKWNPISTGTLSTTIADVKVAPNGYVYVCGNFSTIGGVAAARVAYWDGSAWNAMGSGISTGTLASALYIAPDGNVYVGGDFSAAGGLANCNNIARWDGSSWHRLGQYQGLNGSVQSITGTDDGDYLYVGGGFTDEFGNPGTTLNCVAKYNIQTGQFSALGTGFTGGGQTVYAVVYSESGVLFAGGTFTASGSTPLSNIAQWNGSAWGPLGSGVSDRVRDMDIDNDDILYVGGSFLTAGGEAARFLAIWNGSTWITPDIYIPSAASADIMRTVKINRDTNDLYIAGDFNSLNTVYSDVVTITNPGTQEVSPTIYIRGPGTLRYIENLSTQKRLYLNLAIMNQEDVFLDFAQGRIFSAARENLLPYLLPGSDFRAFTLLPGENRIACFMTDDVSAQMSIQFTPQHWGVDATG